MYIAVRSAEGLETRATNRRQDRMPRVNRGGLGGMGEGCS